MELIDRNEVRYIESDIDAYTEDWNNDYERGFGDAINKVLELHIIEAEPVRHGRWKCIGEYEEFSEEMADYFCENCGHVISRLKNQKPKFCERCGSKMDATETNDCGKGGTEE